MDHECFDVLGRWELDRGPQELAYDFWWHLGYDTMVSSEWGTPDMFEDGLIPEKIPWLRVRAPTAFLGFAQAPASAGDRSR